MKEPQAHNTVDADQTIRDYYENQPPSESEGFRDQTETVTSSAELAGKIHPLTSDQTRLSGGDPDVSQQGLDAGTETPGGSNPTPDQDRVDDIGRAAGITYEDQEPLNFGEKMTVRDEARWELNPASSEDYKERLMRQPERDPAPASPSKRRAAAAPRKTARRKRSS